MALKDDFSARFVPGDFTQQEVDDKWAMLDPDWQCYFGANPDTLEEPSRACEKTAALYVMAHLLVIELQDSTASKRSMASKSVDGVSTSYVADSRQDIGHDFFNTTKYGQKFLQITAYNFGAVIA